MDKYKGDVNAQPHNFRQCLKDCFENDFPMYGVGMEIPSVEMAKLIAETYPEWVFIDAEHGSFSPKVAADIIQTIKAFSNWKTIPVIRIPEGAYEWAGWMLDAGAAGIIFPHCETVEQVNHAIKTCRFPPRGDRSYPPISLSFGQAPEGKTWLQYMDERVAVIPQIETKLGVENLEDILQLDGIDAILIGPGDLLLSYGGDVEAAEAAQERICQLAKKYKKPVAGLAFPATMKQRYKQGYRLYTNVVDFAAFSMSIQAGLQEGKDLVAEAQSELQSNQTNGNAN